VDAAVPQWLTPQIKHRRIQIEQIGKSKVAGLCIDSAALAFGAGANNSVIRESELGSDFFCSIILRLPGFDWTQRFRISECTIINVQFP